MMPLMLSEQGAKMLSVFFRRGAANRGVIDLLLSGDLGKNVERRQKM